MLPTTGSCWRKCWRGGVRRMASRPPPPSGAPRRGGARGPGRVPGRGSGVGAGAGVTAVTTGPDGRLTGLVLADGSSLPAGLLVVACGVRPEVTLAAAAGLTVDAGVVVDDTLRSV